MKVDTIETKFGNIDVEYSTFTNGFFIKKFPEKFKEINGLKLLTSRDNSFDTFKELKSYVLELINNAQVDFKFKRKVIIYKLYNSFEDYSNNLGFEYLICDESEKCISYLGKENELREYFVHESNNKRYIGKRNILGQILFSGYDKYIIIDYDKSVHKFFKDFDSKFMSLKHLLDDFFNKDKILNNVLNGYNNNNLISLIKKE